MFSAIFTTLFIAAISDISADYEDFESPLFFMRKEDVGKRAKRTGNLLDCSAVTEHPFANCFKLKKNRKCNSTPHLLQKWCPRTCKFCIAGGIPAPVVCSQSRFGCCKDGITAATGLNRFGCPENCKNRRGVNCHYYAKHNYCQTHMQGMRKFCPKACKFCGKKIVDGCYNNWQDSLCQHLADRGTCRDPMWKERLARHCARSCEICTINTPPLEQVRPLCAKEGCCWDNKTPISKGCPPCEDYFRGGLCLRFKPSCTMVGKLQGVQMRIFCPKTCGICNQKECKDDITQGVFCEEWKKKGKCDRDPLAMKVYCKKTCGFC